MTEHQVPQRQECVLVAEVQSIEPWLVMRMHRVEVGQIHDLDEDEAEDLESTFGLVELR